MTNTAKPHEKPSNQAAASAIPPGNRWFKYASPQTFYGPAGKLAPWFAVLSALLCIAGLYVGLCFAPTGAIFTFIALWTGALWGKPTWGTWWVWDARLTSELILLFLYFGFMALQAAIDDPRRADRAGAILALVGVINVPIIYYSVKWWNTLHQGASVSLNSAPTMAMIMFVGMMLIALSFWMYTIAVTLLRVRCLILERERNTDWAAQWASGARGVPA